MGIGGKMWQALIRLNIHFNSFAKTIFLSFAVVLLFWGPSRQIFCQNIGIKYIKNYSRKDYAEHPQNWAVVQDKRGVIYVGNNGGLLEFDGTSWRLIEIPNGPVRSMTVDDTGTIYIGGYNEIGFLKPTPNGSLKYESLREYLGEDNRRFSQVRGTHAANGKIYFRTKEFLFRWDSKALKSWKPGSDFQASFLHEGTLWIHDKAAGLKQMAKDNLTLVPGGETFAGMDIYMIAPYNHQQWLISTSPKGCYLYDGKTASPFPTQADEYLEEKEVYHGIRLSSGEFALATTKGGLVIIDSNGQLKQIFNKECGLLDDNVRHVFEDAQGNIWLGLNYGITRIEYASPFSFYDERSHLPKIVLSVTRHRQRLYVGTTSGLYFLDSSFKTFQPVKGMSSNCWHLLSIGEAVLVATSEGVFQIEAGTIRKIIKDRSYVLHHSKRNEKRLWVGTNGKDSGLIALYKKNGQWKEEYRVKEIKQEIRTIVEDKNGTLWLGPREGGEVLRVNFPDPKKQPVVTRYNAAHGLPPEEIKVFAAADHTIFASGKGIFRFDEGNQRFIPDNTLGDEFAGGSKNVFCIAEGKNKNIWFHSTSGNFQAIYQKDGTFVIDPIPFLRLPPVQVNTIYPDGDIVWFGTLDDLIRFDTTFQKNYRQDFQTLIRKVVTSGKNIIFDGCEMRHGTDTGPGTLFPIIAYENRNLHFEFAATFFEDVPSTRYQWFLEGYDDDWSPWSAETRIDYTNLDAGMYTFRVKAKNVYGHVSREAVFQFKVLPVWFKTWWAFLIYAAMFFLLVYFIVKWRSRKLQLEKQKLEQTVEERTKEINEKNLQLENQTFQLKEQSEKLQEMAKIKSRFFANISHEFRTPLTLIMGPLEKMLSKSREQEQSREVRMMFRNSQRLLTLINQLLDLSKLDSGKMKLQTHRQNIVSFLKGIAASFELLAVERKIDLKFHAEGEDITLYFDLEKLEQVMCNLLINAFKFTPTGGTVALSVALAGTAVEISISDTGIGIPKEKLPHIFDRFYQAEGTVSEVPGPQKHDHKGTGIGLALTRELVQLHGGRINVHSREGKGTEFVIQLPMGKGHLKPHEIVEDFEIPPTLPYHEKPGEMGEMAAQYVSQAEQTETEADEKRVESASQEKNVILVVEDNADVREYIRKPLEPYYNVVEAKDGREGIEKAREIIPDLIISDIMMPEMDGYEMCTALKKDIKTSHVPLILLTAKASEDNIIQGLETGADDYITKPFNTKILCTRIKNLIDLRRQLQLKIQRMMLLQPAEISVSSIDREFIKELQEIIEKNLSDHEFHVEALCKKMYMSRVTLYRKIMALTGENPTQFIRSYRLKRAAQLLKANAGNVSEVALEVGFSNMAYFAKCFKDKFHQLPSTFQASESR